MDDVRAPLDIATIYRELADHLRMAHDIVLRTSSNGAGGDSFADLKAVHDHLHGVAGD